MVTEHVKPSVIDRYRSLRYGLFIHFGLYSVLGGEYKGQVTPFYAEWIRHTLDIPDDEYRQLAKIFKPDHFDANKICQMAKKWGMKYIVFTAKHHDGFALFNTKTDDFNSHSKINRDFVEELSIACQEHDLMLGLYYSQAQDWDHPGGIKAYQKEPEKEFYQDYVEHKMMVQLAELLTNYGPIGYLWLDTPSGLSIDDSQLIKDLVKTLQPDCLIGGRIGFGLGDVIITGDNRMPRLTLDKPWEIPATLNTSWGYKANDTTWRNADDVIHQLIQVISRGGNLLLNIGPDGTGIIPPASERILDAVGDYIKGREEAFFSVMTPPDYPYEQAGFLLTASPFHLYIHLMQTPKNERIELYHLENTVISMNKLGDDLNIDYYVGKDLEGHSYWRINTSHLRGGDIIKVEIIEEKVQISSL